MATTPNKPAILWSCIARNDVILVDATVPDCPWDEPVTEAAKMLFAKKETPGWEFVNYNRRLRGNQPKLKGLKFHVYDHTEEGDFHVWVYACVYDPSAIETSSVQSFVEKMVTISEMFRETDPSWKYGSHLAAQETFQPILLQRMEEVSYLGKFATLQDQVDQLKHIMARNIELILERGEKLEDLQEESTRLQEMAGVFKKKSKTLRRQMLWQNAKHGLLLGTAITAGVAVVVVPIAAL